MQWNNKMIIATLGTCTNKVFKLEYINQISKRAKTSHSYLIQVCHVLLKDFLWSYNIAKHLAPISEAITTNKFTIKNSFEFAKEVIEENSGLFMASLDVESLFTNIPCRRL